eukprot:2852283-Pyramimonas_sp.AAC.1
MELHQFLDSFWDGTMAWRSINIFGSFDCSIFLHGCGYYAYLYFLIQLLNEPTPSFPNPNFKRKKGCAQSGQNLWFVSPLQPVSAGIVIIIREA